MILQLGTFLYENYKKLNQFTLFLSNFMLCTLFFTGIYSMIYSQVALHNFERTAGVPTLILKYVTLVIMLSRFYSFAICWLVVCLIQILIFMGIYNKIKNIRKDQQSNIYEFIYNPKFNLIRYLKDYGKDIIQDPFTKKDIEVLKDQCPLEDEHYIEHHKECCICFDELKLEEKEKGVTSSCLVLPLCSHVFHTVCVQTWLEQKNQCPFCRADVRGNLLKMIHFKVTDAK